MSGELIVRPEVNGEAESRLMDLVLNGVTSLHSRRAYRTGLERFFVWMRSLGSPPAFTKALVQEYRAHLLTEGLASATINLRLSPIRKLAREMADNGMLDVTMAGGVAKVRDVKAHGARVGNWLTKAQAMNLVNAPSADTLGGKRDRALLAMLIGCGLRRAEVLRLSVEDLQQREGRWVLPDMIGKGNRVRTVTVPSWVKAGIDVWLEAAGVGSGPIFRAVGKGGRVAGTGMQDEKAVWEIVMRYAKETKLGKLAPHDLRRTCAKLCRKSGGNLEQIQLLLGHASVQTTERYLGTKQELSHAVNDSFGFEWRQE